MTRSLVIVGAGLGGCFLANALKDRWNITMVEIGSQLPVLHERVKDTDIAAVTYPHIGSGLGGTTTLWHNGLIEIDEVVFRRHWPFAKSELAPYYQQVYPMLAGVPWIVISDAFETLRLKYKSIGFAKSLFRQGLFYPHRRVNAWRALDLEGRVNVIEGEGTELVSDRKGKIHHLVVKSAGKRIEISGDVFVIAAGGLGTPLLLQKLFENIPVPALRHAGLHYSDHPSAFVGEVVLDEPLYKLWNYPVAAANGNLRLPIVVEQDGLQVSFQLRPAAQFRIGGPRNRVKSILSQLRNEPLKLGAYFRLLTHWDDVLDILSFKFGVRLPTRHYSLLMVAEQPPSEVRAVWREEDSIIHRKWSMSDSYMTSLQKAIQQLLGTLGDKVRSVNIFPDWHKEIFSSSHHSGTARMALSPDEGVCDANGRVFGLDNLFVCDGSIIPASGYANTGLTIAALARRLADYLLKHTD